MYNSTNKEDGRKSPSSKFHTSTVLATGEADGIKTISFLFRTSCVSTSTQPPQPILPVKAFRPLPPVLPAFDFALLFAISKATCLTASFAICTSLQISQDIARSSRSQYSGTVLEPGTLPNNQRGYTKDIFHYHQPSLWPMMDSCLALAAAP